MAVERAPGLWVNAPRPALARKPRGRDETADIPVRTLVQMDAPDHTAYRKISIDWFKQSNIVPPRRSLGRAGEASRGSHGGPRG